MADLLFYDKPVALNAQAHRDLKLGPGKGGFGFARKANSVLLAAVEFAEAAKEYPIVFARLADGYAPVVLLGMRQDENLFVDADGQWRADYIPAFVRRYPFVVAEIPGSDQMAVCIDEACPDYGAPDGEALFDAEGKPGQRLQSIIAFLQDYQDQLVRTSALVRQLADNGLLQEMTAQFTLPSGENLRLSGLHVIDERKLQALSDDQALQLFRSGALAMVYFHLASLVNTRKFLGKAA